MRLFKIVIFRLKLGFLSHCAEKNSKGAPYIRYIFTNNFSKTIRNLDVISWVKRYIRIIFRLTKEEAEVQKALPFGPARYIRSLRRYTPQQIGFSKNPKGPPFYNFKKFELLSLRYGADFKRSRLVQPREYKTPAEQRDISS